MGKKEGLICRIWRILYPIGIHFGISQVLVSVVVAVLAAGGYSRNEYYRYALYVTGLTNIVSMIPAAYLYLRDRTRRRITESVSVITGEQIYISEGILLFIMGASLSLYINLLMMAVQRIIPDDTYAILMNNVTYEKSFPVMVVILGILGPMAEEMIFRWLVYLRIRDHRGMITSVLISSLLFGVYHRNLFQTIYAAILGAFFAWTMEKTGNLRSSVLVHAGANCFSLWVSEYGTTVLNQISTYGLTLGMMLLLVSLMYGSYYFGQRAGSQKEGGDFGN